VLKSAASENAKSNARRLEKGCEPWCVEEKFMEFILGFAIWVGDGGWKIGEFETQ